MQRDVVGQGAAKPLDRRLVAQQLFDRRAEHSVAGSAAAKSTTREAGLARPSRCPSRFSASWSMPSLRFAIRRGVKALLTNARSWLWRGGSIRTIIGRNDWMKSEPGGLGNTPSTEE